MLLVNSRHPRLAAPFVSISDSFRRISLCKSEIEFYCCGMGFSFKTTEAEGVEVFAGSEGANLSTFLEAVKQCIGQRAMSITVNVTADPKALSEIAEPLQKLQRFVAGKAGALKLTGSGLKKDDPLYLSLTALGVVVTSDEAPPESEAPAVNPSITAVETPPVAANLSDLSFLPEVEKIVNAFGIDKTLPQPASIEALVKKTKDVLADLLKKMEDLEKERLLYQVRLDFITKNNSGDTSNIGEFETLQKEEQKIMELRNTVPELRKEMVRTKEELEKEEKAYTEFSTKFEADSKKKYEAVKKELDKIKDTITKAEAEIKKKSDQRKTDLQKLQDASSAGATPSPEKPKG